MPDKFKTPGTKVAVNTGQGGNTLICDEAMLADIRKARADALEAMRVAELPAADP